MAESVPSVLDSDARGDIADIYADIRKVLGTSVVNLIWRNLATMPGARNTITIGVLLLVGRDAPGCTYGAQRVSRGWAKIFFRHKN